ncbi:uncharacterized protein LOC123307805 [Coccinella septempunctata]|uniref:uncharacterized protein LOC123307805 n=1 Tax=Coccinella septempunctata TaxID=41139 RepID=UPI001D08E411|nr:uncharacterized protein LOC123307805 [Coccinella septempunctata]
MINTRSVVLLVLIVIHLSSANAEDGLEARKKHHIKHGLFYGSALIQYLTFLAIKVKLVLVIGVIFTVIVFGGKLFALVKYAGFQDSYHHPKEVYIHSPHDAEYIQDHSDFIGPHEIEHPFKRFSTVNYDMNKRKNDNLAGYKRSSTNINYIEKLMSFLMRLNLTERIFKEMKMDRVECRKKFVCETKFIAENSSLFRAVMRLMSDSTFESYKPNNKTNSIAECRNMYPNCEVR